MANDLTKIEEKLAQLMRAVDDLSDIVARQDREIERLCEERYPETRLLQSIRGIGPITALSFVLTIEDRKGFRGSVMWVRI